jgi:predicted nuclease of predicted toxin-antitoxin system
MKFLFDQNISQRILRLLPDTFDGSTHVKSEGLINYPDYQIWEFAKRQDYIVVTQDSDFNDLNSLFGFPPKIIWIRTGNIKTQAILDILIEYYDDIEKFIEDKSYGCFEIIRISKK